MRRTCPGRRHSTKRRLSNGGIGPAGYGGIHLGTAFGTSDVSDPYGPSIFGDTIRTPGFLLGGQFGYNWQMPDKELSQ
jgi:opacity protein-like surface antigen